MESGWEVGCGNAGSGQEIGFGRYGELQSLTWSFYALEMLTPSHVLFIPGNLKGIHRILTRFSS